MNLYEKELEIPVSLEDAGLLDQLRGSIESLVPEGAAPVRIAISESSEHSFKCEIGVAENLGGLKVDSILDFRRRGHENQGEFNAVLIVPTGIGAEIGGHAGDAGPIATLLAESCDTLITHPNVVNASDINELPENALYVEGSVLSRLLMGTVGLAEVRSNRVLGVIEKHPVDEMFSNASINAFEAARASYGLDCRQILMLESELSLSAEYSSSGTAVGRVENLDKLVDLLEAERGTYDAIALSSIIKVPREFHAKYFKSGGEMVNPWGGVEAIFTHFISSVLDVPAAHAPMLEDQLIANFDPGVVDPRLAAEAVSLTFLQCVLKGLKRAPRLVSDATEFVREDVLSARDVSCVVIPDGVLGLPVLAALEQGITVIAVRENSNLMKNDLTALPWAPGQLVQVDTYLEAVGAMLAIKAGLALDSLRRPIANILNQEGVQKGVSQSNSYSKTQSR